MLVPVETGPQSPWSRLARAPATTERLGKWQEQLTEKDVALIEWTVGPELGKFGYSKSAAAASLLTVATGLAHAAFDAVRRRLVYFPGIVYRVLAPTRISREEFWIYRTTRAARAKAAAHARSRYD
jgi:hypothetical protein